MNINQTLIDYFDQTAQLTYLGVCGKVLRAYLKKEKINTAMLGSDNSLFSCLEAVCDSGIFVNSFYAGNPEDIFHPSKPLNTLNPSDFDLLLVSSGDVNKDKEILNALKDQTDNYNLLNSPILLAGEVRTGIYNTLCQITEFRTCLNARKLATVAAFLRATNGGCIVECGTYKGGTTVFAGLLQRFWNDQRKYYAFDTFEGMPSPTESDGETVFQEGTFTETSVEEVTSYLNQFNLLENTTLKKGLIQDTIDSVIEEEKEISFALVDTDQYQGTIESLKKIVPALSINGTIIVDDYDIEGVKKAVDEAKELFPTLRGTKCSHNFYLLWDKTDKSFLTTLN